MKIEKLIKYMDFTMNVIRNMALKMSENILNNDPDGKLNSDYSFFNVIGIAIGSIIWALIVLGFIVEIFGINLNEY